MAAAVFQVVPVDGSRISGAGGRGAIFSRFAGRSEAERGPPGERGSHRLSGQCLRGKARMLCRLSKSKIRRDVKLDRCKWGSVGWMAKGASRGLHNLGTFVAYDAEGPR